MAESDPTELELIATVLARDGFRVLQALEREQAMSLFASEEVLLVIAASDVSGRGGGAALCTEVKKQKPATRFIILHPSGNDPDARAVLLSRTGCDAVLPSPFRYDALKKFLGEWGFAAPPRAAAAVMSFAVPVPDVTNLVAPPSVGVDVAPPPPPPNVLEVARESRVVTAEPRAELMPIPIPVLPMPLAIHDEPTVDQRSPMASAAMLAEPPIAESPIAEPPIAELPIAEVPIAEPPIAEVPIAEPPIAESPIAESPIAELPIAELPIAELPIAELPIAEPPIAESPTAEPPIAEVPIAAAPPPSPPKEAPAGDWLLARPSADAPRDGFAGLDFGSGLDNALDSALDSALGETPTARLEALPDDAARSVAMAVQAYVAEALGFDDEPTLSGPVDPVPELPQLGAGLSEPPPVLPASAASEGTLIATPPQADLLALSAHDTETVEIQPAAWEVTEPGASRGESVRPAVVEAYRDSIPAAWEMDEPRSLAAPLSVIAEHVAAGHGVTSNVADEPVIAEPPVEPPPPPVEAGVVEPPPPPVEAVTGVSAWKATGASTWSPPAPAVSLPARVAAVTPPPPPPVAAHEPPPPPREALHEPPALPFEAIVQRTPVGAEPRTTLPPSVPPEGDLATTPLPRLLFELYGGTYCGTLRLSRSGADRIIDVWNGFPVAVTVTPDEDDDDIATILRDHGRITPEQHADAKRRAGSRAAQLLVALGVIDERDLLDCIREQTELRLAASFSWRDGTYKITPSRAPPDSVVLSEVHPVKIIWRGVCEHYDVGSLLAFFSPLRARYIVATEVFPIHYESLGPFLRSVGVAHLLNGKTTFEQALRSDDSHALTIAHTLYVLIVTEMIRAQSKPGEAAKFPDAQGAARPSKPVDYRELTHACEEVARTYLALKGRDYFAMLELERQATERDVLAAYDRLARPFKVENLLPGLPDDVQRRAREIDGLLRRARDTLSSPEERRRYVIRLEENQPPPPPADALAS